MPSLVKEIYRLISKGMYVLLFDLFNRFYFKVACVVKIKLFYYGLISL